MDYKTGWDLPNELELMGESHIRLGSEIGEVDSIDNIMKFNYKEMYII
ncbi:hypothetical protein CSC2_22720 [Clostridium zeae]|uniref:Uncharacterized protein n=1 Tax=Clostridium zeae TaxID=2759022 RepID=A0ABQ1EAP9_9CLOT|nr:hypothetical protein CSC2_22720 [Clostridium zeae]